jgi:NTE family protein
MMYKVGLALSGGGARGLAHIGVLNVLEQAGIAVDCLAGTSMGGFIAAAYASGMTADQLQEEALRMSNPRYILPLLDLSLPRRGLLKGARVYEYVARFIGDRTFDDLGLPLTLVAVDLNAASEVRLAQGRVADAVRATIAVPGVFEPVARGEQLLVDGGLLNNLPADVVREMGAQTVIAVDVLTGMAEQNHCPMPNGHSNTMDLCSRSIMVMMIEIHRHKMERARPQIYLQPDIPASVGVLTGFTRAAEIIAAGARAARETLPQIEALLRSNDAPRTVWATNRA